MPQFGFIRDKLDVKVLVLYLAARVAAPIDFATLTDLCMCDEGVDYFMFAQAVSELVESEHLQIEEDFYTITDKGRKTALSGRKACPFPCVKSATVIWPGSMPGCARRPRSVPRFFLVRAADLRSV